MIHPEIQISLSNYIGCFAEFMEKLGKRFFAQELGQQNTYYLDRKEEPTKKHPSTMQGV